MGFALCGSFCTHGKVLRELEKLCKEYETVQPIVSEICLHTNTRFGTAEEFISAVEKITGHTVMGSVNEAEPIGPKKLLDGLRHHRHGGDHGRQGTSAQRQAGGGGGGLQDRCYSWDQIKEALGTQGLAGLIPIFLPVTRTL